MIKISAKKEVFEDILSAVLVMQNEAVIKLMKDGLQCNVGSLDHTAAVFINAPRDLFDTFEVPEESVSFGIQADEIKKRLARCGQNITLEVENDVKILSDDKRYGVALFNVESFDKHPSFNFAVKAAMPYSDLKRALGDVLVVTETVRLNADGDKIVFSGHGDLASNNVTVSPENSYVSGTAYSFYNLQLLTRMVEAVEVEKAVLEFSENLPLRLTLGNVVYFLAAKVNN